MFLKISTFPIGFLMRILTFSLHSALKSNDYYCCSYICAKDIVHQYLARYPWYLCLVYVAGTRLVSAQTWQDNLCNVTNQRNQIQMPVAMSLIWACSSNSVTQHPVVPIFISKLALLSVSCVLKHLEMISAVGVSKLMYATEALKRGVDMEVWCGWLTLILLTATFQGNHKPEAGRLWNIPVLIKQFSPTGDNWIPDCNLDKWYHNERIVNGGNSTRLEVGGNAVMDPSPGASPASRLYLTKRWVLLFTVHLFLTCIFSSQCWHHAWCT